MITYLYLIHEHLPKEQQQELLLYAENLMRHNPCKLEHLKGMAKEMDRINTEMDQRLAGRRK